MPISSWRTTSLAAAAFSLGTMAGGFGSLHAAWEPIARAIGLQTTPTPASANVLSEHEIEALDGMAPQHQAERLLERSINHYRGANAEIARRLDGWRGHLSLEGRLLQLFKTAVNSDDLTVRVAAVELNIVTRGLTKEAATVDRLEPIARDGAEGLRVNALWDLGLVGNRGVEQDRVLDILTGALHDEREAVRYWAAEGLAVLGVDAAIEPLLATFHDDPSPRVRERAACGVAQSGLFSAAQRRTAVPRLLDFADDWALDPQTRAWVFQALRDITGQSLPHDAAAWRAWHASSTRTTRP